jgi:hypothetical protein
LCEQNGTNGVIEGWFGFTRKSDLNVSEKNRTAVMRKEKLCKQVKHSITQNTTEWETGYICRPSQFFNDCDSIFYADNKETADYECEFIIKTQLPDGSWLIPWGWSDYQEEWAVSKNWWKGNGAIVNMLYLKGMRRLT